MFLRSLSNLLIAIGLVLLAGSAYIGLEQYAAQERGVLRLRTPDQELSAPAAIEVPISTSDIMAVALSVLPPKRLMIPSIKLDTEVVDSHIVNGEWEVPSFVAGHLEGTARPGEKSNVVLVGHVQSRRDGNVFANLEKLQPGDETLLYTEAEEFRYIVRDSRLVLPTELTVVAPTTEERLTLITCGGTFNFLTREYSHRLVVVAIPRANSPVGSFQD